MQWETAVAWGLAGLFVGSLFGPRGAMVGSLLGTAIGYESNPAL